MSKNKWREVSIGDKLYVLAYPKFMLTFNNVGVPEVFTAHVESIDGEETDHNNGTLVIYFCRRDDTDETFRININGVLTRHRTVEIDGEKYQANQSDNIIAYFKNFDGDDYERFATMNVEFFKKFINFIKVRAQQNAKKKMTIIREQLKMLNLNLKIDE